MADLNKIATLRVEAVDGFRRAIPFLTDHFGVEPPKEVLPIQRRQPHLGQAYEMKHMADFLENIVKVIKDGDALHKAAVKHLSEPFAPETDAEEPFEFSQETLGQLEEAVKQLEEESVVESSPKRKKKVKAKRAE